MHWFSHQDSALDGPQRESISLPNICKSPAAVKEKGGGGIFKPCSAREFQISLGKTGRPQLLASYLQVLNRSDPPSQKESSTPDLPNKEPPEHGCHKKQVPRPSLPNMPPREGVTGRLRRYLNRSQAWGRVR